MIGERDGGEEEQLPAARQAERPAVPELDEVVDETDPGATDRDEEDRQRIGRVAAQRQERDRHREHDQEAPHGRGPLLHHVLLRPLLPDLLPELVPAQEGDELRARDDRDQHRDQPRRQNAGH